MAVKFPKILDALVYIWQFKSIRGARWVKVIDLPGGFFDGREWLPGRPKVFQHSVKIATFKPCKKIIPGGREESDVEDFARTSFQ